MPNESVHPLATPAAIAAHCADRQGRFSTYIQELFNRQAILSEDHLRQIAQDVGLNMSAFQTCYDSRDTLPIVKKDYQEGLALGLTATPTLFINGERLVGAVTLDELIQYVERARTKK